MNTEQTSKNIFTSKKFFCFVFSFPLVSQYCSYVFIFNIPYFSILRKCLYTTLSVAGKKQRYIHQRHTWISLASPLGNLLRAFVFPIRFQHLYFCLFYSWRIPFILVANVFIVLLCLQASATLRRLLIGWVGLKKKRRDDVSRGNFGCHP